MKIDSTPDNTPETCDCGHPPTPGAAPGTGYGRDTDGRTMCYACCNAAEVESIRTADRYFGYLTGTPETGYKITTWPGGQLAIVHGFTRRRVGFRDFTGQRPERWYLRARDVHGAEWRGTSPGPGMFARLRRVKAK